ncbi:hypothetical protein C7212DRAFT_165096 [Tuber magnatum]|uniref:Reverse transcriptase Ty1/copia-type domain-containing protein n=1 Tax=Tuber magnatum TaxID=42249 RepID=A0A317T1E2_9PEZI|nr:hypothetical protein C7212DRAFT_165096 [Tuber magnatum]
MYDLGQLRQFLDLEIRFRAGWVSWNQSRFIETVLQSTSLAHPSNSPVSSRGQQQTTSEAAHASQLNPEDQRQYQAIVGSLMYLAVASRPDLAFTVSILSKFNTVMSTEHMAGAE